jgi:hypothetical protein
LESFVTLLQHLTALQAGDGEALQRSLQAATRESAKLQGELVRRDAQLRAVQADLQQVRPGQAENSGMAQQRLAGPHRLGRPAPRPPKANLH